MATYTSPQWSWEVFVPAAGQLAIGYGVIDLTVAIDKDDVLQFFYLPQRAIALRGTMQGADLDTATGGDDEVLEIDVGTTSDSTKYLNSGVLQGNLIAGHVPQEGIFAHLQGDLIADGVEAALTAPEGVIGTVTAAPFSGGTGIIAVMIDYTTGRS